MIRYEAKNLDINDPYTMYYTTNLTWGLHFHRAYECILVSEGLLQCKIDQTTYTLDAGKLLFIMPNQLHSLTTPSFSKIYIIRFVPELIGHFHNTYQNQVPKQSCFEFTSAGTWTEFYNLQKNSPQNIYSLKSLLYKICGELVMHTEFIPRDLSSGDSLIRNLLAYIDAHYTGTCSLKEAAEECCCDYYHASKTFIKYTGISFIDYVNNLRIHRACYLIETTNDTILNISINSGFSSLRSFNRNFLKYCNCTPTDYLHHQE